MPIQRVIVYRESPIWDDYDHWWEVPEEQRAALHVHTYELALDAHAATGEYSAVLSTILDAHPNCVFIFTPRNDRNL